MNHLVSIHPDDLSVLESVLLEELRTCFPFSSGRIFPKEVLYDQLSPIGLSDRQAQRAIEAISQGRAFWDRISGQVLIPISANSKNGLGLVVLRGVSREVSPDEALRWLPVLSALVEKCLVNLKSRFFSCQVGQIPGLLVQKIRFSSQDSVLNVLHIVLKRPFSADKSFQILEGTFSALWPCVRPTLVGASSSELWYLLEGQIKTNAAALGLKGLLPISRLKRLGLKRVFLHTIKGQKDPQSCLDQISRTESTAKIIGTDVFGTSALSALEKRTGIEDLPDALLLVSRSLGKSFSGAIALINHSGKLKGLDNESIFITTGGQGRFLVLENVFTPQDALKKVARLLGPDGEYVTAGIAISGHSKVKGKAIVGASLWAFLHARLLGSGSKVVFDALSWNVAGDELVSLGDVPGAIRAYRKGLCLNPDDSNLWNSLGVCLGAMGRMAQAQKAFEKALALDPHHFMALYNLGGVLQELGRHEEAIGVLESAYRMCPKDIRIATRLSRLKIKRGVPDQAVSILLPLIEKDACNMSCALKVLAQAFDKIGDWPSARAILEGVIKKDPDDSLALSLLAHGYMENEGDHATAQRLFAQAQKNKITSGDRGLIQRLSWLFKCEK